MLCRDLMKTDVECVASNESVAEAARRMRDEEVGFLPVCDPAGRVLGAITDRDITVRLVTERRSPDTPVQDLMTREVVACHPTHLIERAEFLMGRAKVSRIMCIDEDSGHLVGVISLSDIAQVEEGARASETLREVSSREVRRLASV